MTENRYECAVLIAGMHRSGTSALARALMLLGGDTPAELLQPSENNMRGFWESPKINSVNNALLARRRANWHGIAPLLELRPDEDELAAVRAAVAEQFPNAHRPVIKDPRVCRVAPVWIEALSCEADRLVFPLIVRSPAEVAASLTTRNRFSTIHGLLLGTRYNLDAEYSTREEARGIVDYGSLLADWRRAIESLQEQIGWDLVTSEANTGAVDSFISPDLHRQQLSEEELDQLIGPYALVRESWDVMREWVRKGSLTSTASRRLDRLRGDLDRLGALANDILEHDRVLEKRHLELKNNRQTEEQRPSHGDPSATPGLEQVEARLHDLLRRSDKRITAKLEEIRHEEIQSREGVRADYADAMAALEAQHRNERDTLHTQLTEARILVETLRERLDRQAAEHDRQLSEKQQALGSVSGELSSLRGQAAEAHILVETLRERLDKQATEHAREVAAGREQIALLKEDRTQDRVLLAERRTQLEASEDARKNLAARLQETQRMLDEQAHALKVTRGALDEVIVRGQDLEANLDHQSATIARHEAEAVAAAAQLTQLSDEIARVRYEHDQTEARRKDIQDELKDVTRKYRSTQATLARTKAGLDNARARLEASEAVKAQQAAELQYLRGLWHVRAIAMIAALFNSITAPLRRRRERSHRDTELVAASGLFDAAWYLERYRDVAQTGENPLSHYMQHGWRENRDPGPDFSVSRYLRENSDVAAAGIDPLVHYIKFGQAEGRGARKSKLAARIVPTVEALPPSAGVFAPPAAAHTPAVDPDIDIGSSKLPLQGLDVTDLQELAERWNDDPASRGALHRFHYLTPPLAQRQLGAEWPQGFDAMPESIIDAWYISERSIRLRCAGNGCGIVGAFQSDRTTGQILSLHVTAAGTCEIVDIALNSPFHPLLFVVREQSGALSAALLVFPSLLRGGVHYAEFLHELGQPEAPSGLTAFDVSAGLASRLAAIQSGIAKALISRISVDLAGATGTGPLFDPALRGWLRDLFAIPIAAEAGQANPGEVYLTQTVGQEGSREGGASLVVTGDMVPTLAILCLHGGAEEGPPVTVPLAMSHMVQLEDLSQPGLSLTLPQLPLRTPRDTSIPYYRGLAQLQGGSPLRKQPGPAALTRVRKICRTESELLFPVAAAVPITSYRPEGIRLVIDCNGGDAEAQSRTVESLAMQACARSLEIAFLGTPGTQALARAQGLFGERVTVRPHWVETLVDGQPLFSGLIAPGTVLHDWRTLCVLADVASAGAATASCPTVTSVRLGKGWVTRVVANGLEPERPTAAFETDQIQTSAVLWGSTYPVRHPVNGIWLAETEKVKNWTDKDQHRLERADGEHWCTALVTATTSACPLTAPPPFEPPIADPGCFTHVRMFKG